MFTHLLRLFLLSFAFLVVATNSSNAQQLGRYEFTGLLLASCPNNNNAVNSQPTNATFSDFTTVGTTCLGSLSVFNNRDWNTTGTINLGEYNQFTITPDAGYVLSLASLSFSHVTDKSATSWILRSSIDGFASNLATGTVTGSIQTPVVNLSTPAFKNIGAVTFRIYLLGSQNGNTEWSNDNVTVNGTVVKLPDNPGNPTSNSPQCSNPGVTLTMSGTPPVGETWYWQVSPTGKSTANSDPTFLATTSGTYYLRAQNNTTEAWSSGVGSVAVTAIPDVTTPVFALGASSSRCMSGGTITYTAAVNNANSITYSLDATSLAAGNTINSATGEVTFDAAWSGNSVVTVTAVGCASTLTATHTITTNLPVTTPVFGVGLLDTRCQGAATISFPASANNTTGITYTLDGTSLAGGNTINASTGDVTFAPGWYGTSTITASAAGCFGPLTATHTVTTDPTVLTPVFAAGATSFRCVGSEAINYAATAFGNTGITYSIDAASIAGGNSINTTTGTITFEETWIGTTTITATATGCSGPSSASHTIVTRGPVTVPVFTLGASSQRCQAAATSPYVATANYTTAITYTLDAASIAGGNTINASTGSVTFAAGWFGTTEIIATATGCFGPQSSVHTITTIATVGLPVFNSGSGSSRCQGAGSVLYDATATTTTGITYTLNGPSITAGNTINSATGEVTFVAGYAGTTIITASAAGCGGPRTSTHTVTVIATVGTPVFTLGSSTTRCQAATTVIYAASATTNTGITYTLDAASEAGGNTINASTGAVTYSGSWSGTSVITATATGCNGPTVANHTVTITPVVGPVTFTLGSTSERCQGAGSVAYTASAINTTGITYTLDFNSRNNGNSINAATGVVTYAPGWFGTSTITATAAGCTPRNATHVVTVTQTVGTPSFAAGNSSTRCMAAANVTYGATAVAATSITYTLDAASSAGGNTINASTGEVSWAADWYGTTVITATAEGCSGPKTRNHTVTINAPVENPVFALGSTSERCQSGVNVFYTATAPNRLGAVSYTLDLNSRNGGNTINSATGEINWTSTWTGTSVVTASAPGCYGPKTSPHTITTIPYVTVPVFAMGNTSTRCQGAESITYTATANNTTGITYTLNGPSLTAGNTIDAATGEVTYVANYVGTTIITASAAGCSGPQTRTHTVTVTATIGDPVFTLGATSTRCQGATTGNYAASSARSTSRTYELDATSLAAGNTINTSTGVVTYTAAWTGTSTITVTANGCNGPKTAVHTVTTTPTVGNPQFTSGATSVRCQGAGDVLYSATATDNTSLVYSLDLASRNAGNTIVSAIGLVTYAAGWSGTSTITVTANGCNGPKTTTHVVTITPSVGPVVFDMGASSSRCQGADTVTYSATATTTTGIIYSLDANSLSAGNTINANTGVVTYVADWVGTATITATASGCNGPTSSSHNAITNGPVTVPVFAMSATSIRCQGSATQVYSANANYTSGITYSLDAASIAGGNLINASTGAVTFAIGWSGTTVITASAAGCQGPQTSTHTITITPTVGNPVFAAGATSNRCQADGTGTYAATSTNSTGITYTLDASSLAGGNTINSTTGFVTFVASWVGNSTITATATGCNGPRSSTHVVSSNGPVATPTFLSGASSSRCQGVATVTYTATAANSTGITYSLDASSLAVGNTINASTGAVTYAAGWSGTSYVTATAAGCYGPTTAIHTVTITPSVGTPFFTMGSTSTRCNGPGTVTYTATATTNTGLTYSLDAATIAGGNTINASNGTVSYVTGWVGIATITARATGCNGPVTSIHRATSTPSVATPVFALGATSSRCQGAGTVTYSATAANSTSIVYSIDATSSSNGNIIDPNTGIITYVDDWVGTTTITATALGCNGPRTATHSVTVNPNGTPAFVLGPNSTRLQAASSVTYTAIANNDATVTYTLDATSIAGGNSINASTGVVTYSSLWVGFSTITASATGCNGTVTSTHVVMSASSTVTKQLYLSDPSQALDRVDPVATGDLTVASSNTISTTTSTVAVDNSSSMAGSASVVSVSHTTGSGFDRLMMVGISYPMTNNPNIEYVTYGGELLTRVGNVESDGARAVAIYMMVNPPSGTANVDVTFNVGTGGAVVGVTTFTGVNQATPLNTYSANSGNNSNASISVLSANNQLVFAVVGANNVLTSTSGNARWNIAQSSFYGAGKTQIGSAVSATATYNVNGGTSRAWVMAGVSIRPSSGATASFTQTPAMCSPLNIKTNAIVVTTYVNVTSGTMPANPAVTATLRYGSTNIITLSNPTFNSTTNTLTWTGSLASDVTVPTGQAISLDITTAVAGVAFNIRYDAQGQPSKIDLPVSTYIDINSLNVYDAPYPGGNISTAAVLGSPRYVRAVVSDPFGANDITALNIAISSGGGTVAATPVATIGCTKVYQYVWNPATGANYNLVATAKEGFENTVTAVRSVNFTYCAKCPPIAINDSATGAGGSPILIDVLANDFDPNNDINPNSLSVVAQPQNGNALISNGKIVYLPNGTFSGNDEFTYRVCDLTSPTPLCSNAKVYVSIDPTIVDPCTEASQSHVYYIPFPEQDTRTALIASTAAPGYIPIPSNNIRTIISLKILYPNMVIVWDHWEDGLEADITNPIQTTTKVWGDGNPYNGIAPGYPSDIIPPGGSIVLDNTMPAFPRNPANIFFDGKDKIYSSGQITMTQVSGEPSIIGLQCMKTNVSSVDDFGLSFTIPVGENFNSQDFRYTALFIRASENNTTVNIDKDKNGTFETTFTLQEGQSYLVNGGVLTGATVTGDKPIGVDLHFGGVDGYSSREVPIYPATWYSNVYYSPVPTTGGSNTIKDTAAIMLYNNLNRPININWSSGIPSSGVINLPAKTVVRFPLLRSATAAYKFVNPTGESFTAIEIVDSYTPGGGGNSGSTFDWAFNLISEDRLTTFAAIAWAPGSTDGTRNDNPIWVTPSSNTTIYVKYNGDVLNGGSLSPCGLRYDVSYPLNALTHRRLLDSDNDQSGLAVYTCDGTKLAAVYGQDAATAADGNPSWDVGSTIRPYCATKLIVAADDNAFTLTDRPVTIQVLNNDGGFTAVVDPTTVTTTGFLQQPKNGTVTVNSNGTLLYTPNVGFIGYDTLEYSVCSTPTPVVCDVASVVVLVNACPTPANKNIISGRVFLDMNKDGLFNDNNAGVAGAKVYLYADGNCNTTAEPNELKDSLIVDQSGSYQFITYPENTVMDDFDNGAANTCASGSDGSKPWATNWVDAGDAASPGICYAPVQSYTNTNVEVVYDNLFKTNALRVKNPSASATRVVNLSGANAAFISFSYRKAAALAAGKSVTVQVSNGGAYSTVFVINGNGVRDAGYIDVYNQDITAWASATTSIRILTSPNMTNSDTVFLDNFAITYLKYPLCYITKVDPTSVSADYYFSTASQNPMTATSGGSCLFPFDFGLAKKYVTISGAVYNDVNGTVDGQVNGILTGAPAGNTLYAYLVDSTGKIAFKTTVASLSGAYNFPIADINTKFKVVISTVDSALYKLPPASANLPDGWVSVGEHYGLQNLKGTGLEAGNPNSSIDVTTGLVAVTNVNFGIEILPVAGRGNNKAPNPGGDVYYTLPANTFTNSLASSDALPGTVTRIRITAFPDKIASMFINGIEYNRFTFPAMGVIVPTNSSGLPSQVITMDPENGYVRAVLPFYPIDNANRESLVPGEAIIIFSVDTDGDGVSDIDDIDDDNDGITDFVEVCGFATSAFNCLPGSSDPSADNDNDGIINYRDADWLPLNAAGTSAILDSDGDGIPNYLDLDSDNDGIQDVVEAGGVDANGDGIIDNYCDTDGDGLSQNVDANNSGRAGSGVGLGAPDFDSDGILNVYDLDSDNDGIPDIVESFGADANNDGLVDGFLDNDGDGWANQTDGDPNGDGLVENLAAVLVLTGNDPAYVNCANPGTGRPGCYTLRGNSDNHGLPNFLDLDSDGDGITDAIESGITATSYSMSMVSNCTLAKGWCIAVRALPALNLRNTDNHGKPNVYDIDSDNDGITDNIEGQSTYSYMVVTDVDTDNDGLVNVYDTYVGVGGNGLTPYNHDADALPDYLDLDSDNDGAPDRNEGDKINMGLSQATINASPDADGDGLVDYFDIFNLLNQSCSYGFRNVAMSNMGPNGNFHGPAPGGSNLALVKSQIVGGDRDFRNAQTLPLHIVSFTGKLQDKTAVLTWKSENQKEIDYYVVERSFNGQQFTAIGTHDAVDAETYTYTYLDDLSQVSANVYYRIKEVNKAGDIYYTSVVVLKPSERTIVNIKVFPNPSHDVVYINLSSTLNDIMEVNVIDAAGKVVISKKFSTFYGQSKYAIPEFRNLESGLYILIIKTKDDSWSEKVIKQ